MPVSNKALKDLYKLLGELRKSALNGNEVDGKNIHFVIEAIDREQKKLRDKEKR